MYDTDTHTGLDRGELDDLAASLDGMYTELTDVVEDLADISADDLAKDLDDLGLIQCGKCSCWMFTEAATRGNCEDCA